MAMNKLSTKIQVKQDANKLHPWPSDIIPAQTAAGLNLYNKAQLQRAHSDWTPLDLAMLARACKGIALLDEEFEKYLEEDTMIWGGKNGTTKVENPRGRAIATLDSTVRASLNFLSLSKITDSEKRTRNQKSRAELEHRINNEEAANSGPEKGVSDDSLLN